MGFNLARYQRNEPQLNLTSPPALGQFGQGLNFYILMYVLMWLARRISISLVDRCFPPTSVLTGVPFLLLLEIASSKMRSWMAYVLESPIYLRFVLLLIMAAFMKRNHLQ